MKQRRLLSLLFLWVLLRVLWCWFIDGFALRWCSEVCIARLFGGRGYYICNFFWLFYLLSVYFWFSLIYMSMLCMVCVPLVLLLIYSLLVIYQLTIKEKERKRNNWSDEIEYFVFMQSVIVSLTLWLAWLLADGRLFLAVSSSWNWRIWFFCICKMC